MKNLSNRKIDERNFWNRVVTEGELQKPFRSPWESYHWEKIFQTLTSLYDFGEKRVFVGGCGTGIFEEWLLRSYSVKKIVGMDISEKMVELAMQRCREFREVEFISGDMDATGYPAGFFDVCVIIDALHHMPDEHSSLKEMSRIGKNLILSEPNALNPIRRLNERKFRGQEVTERSFHKLKLRNILRELGYQKIVVRNCHFIPSFVPPRLLRVLRPIDTIMERVPLFKEISGSLNFVCLREGG